MLKNVQPKSGAEPPTAANATTAAIWTGNAAAAIRSACISAACTAYVWTAYATTGTKEEQNKMEAERRRSSHSSSGLRYAVKKSGNGTVALLGFPSVGKSTILNKLTNAFSEIGAYDFTTITIVPGSMSYKGANIQILDMPGIIEGASDGRGRGKAVISVARTSDLILLIVDPVKSSISALIKEAESANIKLNGYKPNIVITPKTKGGGLKIVSTVKLTHIDEQLIGEVVREWGIVNGEVIIREDVTVDQLIDVLSGNRVYIPAIIVVGILASLSTPAPLTIVQNGVVFNINPRTAQPVGFNLSQSATITGSFTTSAPVTFYIMTPSEYASLLPSGTASSYVYTSGSVSSGSINTNVGAGTYYLVFVNYNSLTTDTVQITAAFVATAS